MGREKDTGRTLAWTSEAPTPHAALLPLMLMSLVLEMSAVFFSWLKLGTVVLLKMEPLTVVVALVGMLLGVMGLLK